MSSCVLGISKLVKNSGLPLAGKVAMSLGGGIVGLSSYKKIQNVYSSSKPRGSIILEIDSLKTNAAISSPIKDEILKKNQSSVSNDPYVAKSILDPTDSIGDKDYYIISAQSVEGLTWDFYMHIGMILILINVIIFLVMKLISEQNIAFNFVKKLPLGNYIYIVLNKLKNLWNKTTLAWIFIGLFFILYGCTISAWGTYIIINNLG